MMRICLHFCVLKKGIHNCCFHVSYNRCLPPSNTIGCNGVFYPLVAYLRFVSSLCGATVNPSYDSRIQYLFCETALSSSVQLMALPRVFYAP